MKTTNFYSQVAALQTSRKIMKTAQFFFSNLFVSLGVLGKLFNVAIIISSLLSFTTVDYMNLAASMGAAVQGF